MEPIRKRAKGPALADAWSLRYVGAVDRFTTDKRSWIMSRVRSEGNSLELRVRGLLKRFRLVFESIVADLTGRPDFVFRRKRKVIFVHGCFWHRHHARNCQLCRMPK